MGIWQLFAVIGLLSLILEMTIPSMFFLNFAVAGFITALLGIFVYNITVLILAFAVISLVSLLVLRPLLIKQTSKNQETGLESKYIGKTAKVIEPISKDCGVISIYDERWEARSEEEIPAGCEVEIVKNESLIMYVKERK